MDMFMICSLRPDLPDPNSTQSVLPIAVKHGGQERCHRAFISPSRDMVQ